MVKLLTSKLYSRDRVDGTRSALEHGGAGAAALAVHSLPGGQLPSFRDFLLRLFFDSFFPLKNAA